MYLTLASALSWFSAGHEEDVTFMAENIRAMQQTQRGRLQSAAENESVSADAEEDRIMTDSTRALVDKELHNFWIDKVNAVIQCPAPLKFHSMLLNWKDKLVNAVTFARSMDVMCGHNMDGVRYNGRKDMYLRLSRHIQDVSMMIIEKEHLLGKREIRRRSQVDGHINPSDAEAAPLSSLLSGAADDSADMPPPEVALMKASLFKLHIMMATLEEDWDKLEQMASKSGKNFLPVRIESGSKRRSFIASDVEAKTLNTVLALNASVKVTNIFSFLYGVTLLCAPSECL
jgi:hypothetical protein